MGVEPGFKNHLTKESSAMTAAKRSKGIVAVGDKYYSGEAAFLVSWLKSTPFFAAGAGVRWWVCLFFSVKRVLLLMGTV